VPELLGEEYAGVQPSSFLRHADCADEAALQQ
jgi:hypothetical protein